MKKQEEQSDTERDVIVRRLLLLTDEERIRTIATLERDLFVKKRYEKIFQEMLDFLEAKECPVSLSNSFRDLRREMVQKMFEIWQEK